MKFISYESKHFALIHKWHTDEKISPKIGYEQKPTEQETAALLDNWLNDKNRIFLLAEHLGKIIGYATLSEINKQYETATLHTVVGEKEFLRQKSCVKIMDEILRYGFDILKFHRIATYVMSNNLKLIETAKKYGWTEEGILRESIKLNGQRLNCHIFSFLKEEFKNRGGICQH